MEERVALHIAAHQLLYQIAGDAEGAVAGGEAANLVIMRNGIDRHAAFEPPQRQPNRAVAVADGSVSPHLLGDAAQLARGEGVPFA